MADKNDNTPESMLNSFEKVSMPMNSSISQDGVQRYDTLSKISWVSNTDGHVVEQMYEIYETALAIYWMTV